jgi:glutamyl-tRNA(Gln) amidotransferase subunit D
MEEDVRIIYFHPGMKPEAITEKKGLVLTGTGLSHVSTILLPRITKLIKNGSVIIMTSQCLFGRVNMRVYSAGRDLIKAGVILGEDMLPETAYVKLMGVLAHAKTKQEVEQLMMTNIAGEIAERMKSNAFLQQNN